MNLMKKITWENNDVKDIKKYNFKCIPREKINYTTHSM